MIGLSGFAAVFVLWNLVCIVALRAFGIRIPLFFLFRASRQRERNLIASLQGRSKNTYILVSGFLFFSCPIFLGLIAYDRLAQSGNLYSPGYYIGSALVLVVLAFGGISIGRRTWMKSRPSV